FVVGAVLVLVSSKRAALSALLGFGAVLVLSRAAVLGFLWSVVERGHTEQEFFTLSDRVTYWQLAWQKFLEQPLLGYGAYAGGKFVVIAQSKSDIGGLHSDYAEVLVGTGLLGLILVVITLLWTWRLLLEGLRSP